MRTVKSELRRVLRYLLFCFVKIIEKRPQEKVSHGATHLSQRAKGGGGNEPSKRQILLFSCTRKSSIISRNTWSYVVLFVITYTQSRVIQSHRCRLCDKCASFKNYFVPLFDLKGVLVQNMYISYKDEFDFYEKRILMRRNSFSYKWIRKKTRFDPEAKLGPEMAQYNLRTTRY